MASSGGKKSLAESIRQFGENKVWFWRDVKVHQRCGFTHEAPESAPKMPFAIEYHGPYPDLVAAKSAAIYILSDSIAAIATALNVVNRLEEKDIL